MFHVKFEQDIEDDYVRDLLITALEGGSNYWYMIENKRGDGDIYHAPFNSKAGVVISDRVAANPGEITFKTLNRDTMTRGLELMAKEYPEHWAQFINEEYDATTADIWLQLALFEKVIYG